MRRRAWIALGAAAATVLAVVATYDAEAAADADCKDRIPNEADSDVVVARLLLRSIAALPKEEQAKNLDDAAARFARGSDAWCVLRAAASELRAAQNVGWAPGWGRR